MRRPSERERACDGTRCDFCASRSQASRDDEGRCARGRVGSSLPRRARWFPRGLRPRRGPATTTARGGRLKARPPGRFDVDGDVNGMTTPHPDLGAFCTQNATQADGVTGSASVPVIKKKKKTLLIGWSDCFFACRAWLLPFGGPRDRTARRGRRVSQCGGEECSFGN